MHSWNDTGIVLSVAAYGEQSAVVKLLTEHHGLAAGMVKGAMGKKNRAAYQPGNVLHIAWSARLEEHLGQMRCELVESHAGVAMASPLALKLVNALTSLLLATVPERIEHIKIFNHASSLLDILHLIDEKGLAVLTAYVRMELALLEELGLGLDFAECAATGSREQDQLVYVSPKSGRAVSAEAGRAYHDKMLPLPEFLKAHNAQKTAGDMQQVLDGLRVSGYFLDSRLLNPEGRSLPKARVSLVEMVGKLAQV